MPTAHLQMSALKQIFFICFNYIVCNPPVLVVPKVDTVKSVESLLFADSALPETSGESVLLVGPVLAWTSEKGVECVTSSNSVVSVRRGEFGMKVSRNMILYK